MRFWFTCLCQSLMAQERELFSYLALFDQPTPKWLDSLRTFTGLMVFSREKMDFGAMAAAQRATYFLLFPRIFTIQYLLLQTDHYSE